jgi:membrane complex biogenesis BtpA family protein
VKEKNYQEYFQSTKHIIAMVHVQALPGTPGNNMSANQIIDKAIREAYIYRQNGIETVAIENMHDVPYTKNIGPEITSMMAVVGNEIKTLGLYCGIQILAGGNKEALAAAKAANLDFIRAEGYVFAHVGDEGYFESCAGDLLRYRKQIGAENILVFTDIKKKHSSHAITDDVNIVETAKAAKFFLSDGIVVTGNSTGVEPDVKELEALVGLPMKKLIGSGITLENIEKYYPLADAFIIGSAFKKDGYWANELDKKQVNSIINKFIELKNHSR